jgi:hypothetical protein
MSLWRKRQLNIGKKMNTEDIIRMAREAGFTEVKVQGFEFPVSLYTASIHDIKRLLETEREECAKLCDMVEDDDLYFGSQYAAAIRERGAP